MGFIIQNPITGQYVEMNTTNSRYCITNNKSKSHHFKKRKRAMNFLDNDTQRILTQQGWEIVSDIVKKETNKPIDCLDKPIISASSKVDSSLDDMERLKNFNHFEANSKLSESFTVPNINIIETIKEFEKFLKKMNEYAQVLSKQYTYIEYCELDYRHKIEFATKELDVLKRAELLTNYNSCLEQRRRIKDDILILEKLLNSSIMDLVDGTVDEFLKELEERYYVPRVAPELFEDTSSVQVKPKFKLDTVQKDTIAEDIAMFNNNFNGSLLTMISDGFELLPDCGD